jgi:hypothetical protein
MLIQDLSQFSASLAHRRMDRSVLGRLGDSRRLGASDIVELKGNILRRLADSIGKIAFRLTILSLYLIEVVVKKN